MRNPSAFLVLSSVVSLWACGSDDPVVTDEVFTAITYNAGFAEGFVDYAKERVAPTSTAMGKAEPTVMCAQEVWLVDQVAAVKEATMGTLPNAIFLDPAPEKVTRTACVGAETDALLSCVETKCADKLDSPTLVGCVLGSCGDEYGGVLPDCKTCLNANVGKKYSEIKEQCTTETEQDVYTYGGSFGIGLMTSATVLEQDDILFDSHANRRGAIYAKLDTSEGEVHAFCTHLSAVFTDIPYPEATGSWAAEQAVQITELLAWVGEKAGADGKVLLMGDMNTGPKGNSYVAEVPENYTQLLSTGLSNVYIQDGSEACTFCEDNLLVEDSADDDTSVVIDHLLVRGLTGTAERVLDGTIVIESEGKEVETSLSDHYGLKATLAAE